MPIKFRGTKPETEIDRQNARRDPMRQLTGRQIDAYIENNVNSLDDAKRVLKRLAKMVILNGNSEQVIR